MEFIITWIIIALIIYLGIGLFLGFILCHSGGEKFSLNKKSIPFILSWPILLLGLFIKN